MYSVHFCTFMKHLCSVYYKFLLHLYSFYLIVPIAVSVSPKTVVHTTTTNASTINCTASGIPEPILQFINISCMYESDQQVGEADEGVLCRQEDCKTTIITSFV